MLYPTKKKRSLPTRKQNILLFTYNDKLSLKQRKEKFLHDLCDFENIKSTLCSSEFLGEIRHTYTYFKLIYKVYVYYKIVPNQENYFSQKEIRNIAISKVDKKIITLFL